MIENKTKKDIGIGLFFVILAILYLVGTFNIQSYSPFGQLSLSSKTIPQVLAVLMIILGLLVLIPACLEASKASLENKSSKTESNTKKLSTGVVKFALAVALLVVYAFCFSRIGFIISTCVYLSCMIYMLLPNKTKRNTIIAIVFSILVSFVIYFIFNKCLGLILPSGIFGF